ncbi:MAG: hypothetical protein Q4A37_01680 [Candidatus Saccharibacteria bacterium]|nr:hypothetical protein [Candidatus Saccharibacteria bacterium]
MKKFGMVAGLMAVMLVAGGATVWGLMSFYPKQEQAASVQTQNDNTAPSAERDSEERSPAVAQKTTLPLTSEAKFTPQTFATIELPVVSSSWSASVNGQWNRLQSADGALKIAIGNTDGAVIAKNNSKSESRTREAALSMGRVILGQYKDMNPQGIDVSIKEAVSVLVRGTGRALEFQEVHYTYTAADGKRYRDITLVRHGAARNLFVIATKQADSWTDDERTAFIRSVRVVNYAE